MKHRYVCIVICLVMSVTTWGSGIDYAAGLQAGLTFVYLMQASAVDLVTCVEISTVQFLFVLGFIVESEWYWNIIYFKLLLVFFFLAETYETVEVIPTELTPFLMWTETRLAGAGAYRWREKFGTLPF